MITLQSTKPTKPGFKARFRQAAIRYVEAMAYVDPIGMAMYPPLDQPEPKPATALTTDSPTGDRARPGVRRAA